MERFNLAAQSAAVIGGTGSLGGAIASGLAEAGARVSLLGRNREKGQARTQAIQRQGGAAEFVTADALDRASLEQALRTIREAFGTPSILVNAAGGNEPKATLAPGQSFEDITLEAWRRNFDLNLVAGVLLPCQVFGSAMIERGRGSIINLASVSAHVPLSRVVSYSAAKASVLSLTQFLAREWAAKGIRVNSITPGFFPAEQNRRLLFREDGSPSERGKAILGHTPMARFGQAKELIGASIFLASEAASSFVTGADLRVDGGFLSQTI